MTLHVVTWDNLDALIEQTLAEVKAISGPRRCPDLRHEVARFGDYSSESSACMWRALGIGGHSKTMPYFGRSAPEGATNIWDHPRIRTFGGFHRQVTAHPYGISADDLRAEMTRLHVLSLSRGWAPPTMLLGSRSAYWPGSTLVVSVALGPALNGRRRAWSADGVAAVARGHALREDVSETCVEARPCFEALRAAA